LKIVIIFLCFFSAWLITTEAQIILNGTLLIDEEKPVPDTRVGIAGGPSDVTDSKGQFSIKLSLDFIEGERVILNVSKKDWIINHPLDGEWNLPNIKLQNIQYTKVIIVPKGSMKLWTHARIEKYIGLLSDEVAKIKKEGLQPKHVDFSFYLKDWAKIYGFTPSQVKQAFDDWVEEVKDTVNERTIALRKFYQQNFKMAAQYFEAAALNDEAELKEIELARRQKKLQAYTNWKDAGNSLTNLYQFDSASTRYQRANQLLCKKSRL